MFRYNIFSGASPNYLSTSLLVSQWSRETVSDIILTVTISVVSMMMLVINSNGHDPGSSQHVIYTYIRS